MTSVYYASTYGSTKQYAEELARRVEVEVVPIAEANPATAHLLGRPAEELVGRALDELLTGAARPILDRWFQTDVLKAMLATDAIIGSFLSIS